MIKKQIDVNVTFIGIQPAQVGFGMPLSDKVEQSLKNLIELFTDVFGV
jgi:hypothetical protein